MRWRDDDLLRATAVLVAACVPVLTLLAAMAPRLEPPPAPSTPAAATQPAVPGAAGVELVEHDGLLRGPAGLQVVEAGHRHLVRLGTSGGRFGPAAGVAEVVNDVDVVAPDVAIVVASPPPGPVSALALRPALVEVHGDLDCDELLGTVRWRLEVDGAPAGTLATDVRGPDCDAAEVVPAPRSVDRTRALWADPGPPPWARVTPTPTPTPTPDGTTAPPTPSGEPTSGEPKPEPAPSQAPSPEPTPSQKAAPKPEPAPSQAPSPEPTPSQKAPEPKPKPTPSSEPPPSPSPQPTTRPSGKPSTDPTPSG